MSFLTSLLLSATPAGGFISLLKNKTVILILVVMAVILATVGYLLYQKSTIDSLKKDVVVAKVGEAKAVDAATTSSKAVKTLEAVTTAIDIAEVSAKKSIDKADEDTTTIKNKKDQEVSVIKSNNSHIDAKQVIKDISKVQLNSVWLEFCLFNPEECKGETK
jgi:hypothetical protein